MDQNYAEQQSRQDQIIYSRIERVIAYKNVQFILEHQNDTLEQLSAYLQSCMEDIGHPPAPVRGDRCGLHHLSFWHMANSRPLFLQRQDDQHQESAPIQRTQDRP